MQVRIEDVSPVEKKLMVEVPWDTVSARLDESYRELSKGVQIKGFRKGKVPRPVLEKMYGPRVAAEVSVQLVRESFIQAVQQHNLAAVSEPRVEEASKLEKGKPFTFAAIIEVRTQVEPVDYVGMPLERRKLAIADEAVEKSLENLRREHTQLEPIEGRTETAAGDVLALAIAGTIGEHPVSQPRFLIDLDDAEREPVPGLRAALTGVAIETKDRMLELPIGDDHAD